MTKREMLHDLVDQLPEREVPLALRILEAIQENDEAAYSLDNAPIDDEPFDPADLDGVETDPVLSHDEVKRRLAG